MISVFYNLFESINDITKMPKNVPVAHFVLPEYCWTENYYKPILDRSEAFLRKHGYKDEVKEFVGEGNREAEMYERFKNYCSYVFYIARKR